MAARTGRFLNRDPIDYGGGINLYAYAGNNPVTGSDPSGEDVIIGPANAPWLDFTASGTKEGLKTGFAATGKALSFGHYSGDKYQNEPGFQTSYYLAVVGREAAIQAAGGKILEVGSRVLITSKLARYAAEAKAAVTLTAKQRAAVAAGRISYNLARGQRIHKAVGILVEDDPVLSFLLKATTRIRGRYQFGPDFTDKLDWIWGKRWFDLTTDQAQWASHVAKYDEAFGRGYPIFYGR